MRWRAMRRTWMSVWEMRGQMSLHRSWGMGWWRDFAFGANRLNYRLIRFLFLNPAYLVNPDYFTYNRSHRRRVFCTTFNYGKQLSLPV